LDAGAAGFLTKGKKMRTIMILVILSAMTVMVFEVVSLQTLRDTDRRTKAEAYRPHYTPLFPNGEKLDSILTAQYNAKELPLEFEIGKGE
jgi:hypothetical protein